MNQITLTCSGQSSTFTADDVEGTGPITVGRSLDCSLSVDDPRVSRLPHLEITHTDGHWVLTDRSSGGTYALGNRIDQVSLPGEHAFTLGAPDGPELRISVTARATETPAPRPPPPGVDPAGNVETTALHPPTAAYDAPAPPPPLPPASPPQQPPPPPQPPPVTPSAPFDPNATVMLDERNLRIVVGDTEYNLAPGQQAMIGRGDECDIIVADPLVSRQHARVEHDGTNWTLTDLGSSRGTFIDHKKIKGTQAVEGAFYAVLGDDDAGERVRFVTGGTHHRQTSRAPLFAGLVALLAIVVAGAAFLASRGDNEPSLPDGAANTAEQAQAARLATAVIFPTDRDLTLLGFSGTGALLDQDGLVLTNAHVAFAATHDERTRGAVGAPGADLADGTLFFVGFATEDQQDVDMWFVAEPVDVHGYHDAATIQIIEECGRGGIADCDRDPMGRVDIEPLRVGTDADLTVGDDLAMFGFPGLAATRRVSVANINFQSYKPVLNCEEPFERLIDSQLVCTLDDAVPEGWLNLSGEGLGPGSSGGPIVRNGRLIGITQGFRLNPDDNSVPGTDVAVPIDEIRKDLAIPDPS